MVDILFRSAHFGKIFAATGVRDQLLAPVGEGRGFGRSFRTQQWLGLKWMVAFSGKAVF